MPSVVDPFALVHPDLRSALPDLIARDPAFPGGPSHVITTEEMRQLLPVLRKTWILDASHVPQIARQWPIEVRTIPGPADNPELTVLVVGADPTRRRPAILHMHGGGFIVGRAIDYMPVLQAQALALDCIIVSVEYRLAPEAAFPGALEDNYAALKWLWAEADALGIDRTRIAVQGESAGGGHAAMLAIAARDRGEVPIMFQCLTYPMLDDRTASTRSVPDHMGNWCWTAKYNRMGWSALLNCPAGSDVVPAGSVPARTQNLEGLPSAFVWVGTLDLFLEEDMDYARRLAHAGVPVELHVCPGAYHGFDGAAPGSELTIHYKLDLICALARAFGITPHPDSRKFLTPRAVQRPNE